MAVKVVALRPDSHAAAAQLLGKRRNGALRQSALPPEHGARAQRTRHRQQKAQRGAALAAGQDAKPLVWGGEGRDDINIRLRLVNVRPQSPQAGEGGAYVGGQPRTADAHRRAAQSGGDEEPVRHGLGGGSGDDACAGAGEKDLLHASPPSRSQRTNSSAGMVSTRQRPTASGRTRDRDSPRRFLSDRAAAASACAENAVVSERP